MQVGEAWVYPGMTSCFAIQNSFQNRKAKEFVTSSQYKPMPLQLLAQSWDNTAVHKVNLLPVVRLSKSEIANINGEYLSSAVVVEV